MGYYIEQVGGSIELPLTNVNSAVDAIKKWLQDETEWGDWNECGKIEEFADKFGMEAIFNAEKSKYYLYNIGEKLWNQEDFLSVIAKFCYEDSYIEIAGENGDRWRWVIKNGELCEVMPAVDWHTDAIEVESVLHAKQKILDIYRKNELSLREILNTVSVVGLSIEEVLELVDNLKCAIEDEHKA